jgi:hypothetical protein
MTQLKDDVFTIDLDDCTYNSSSNNITINTSSWDDSFTTSPTSIYSSPMVTSLRNGLSVEGDLKVDGVDVMQSIKDMQRVLGVVSRDIEKEQKYAGLKLAAEAYERELAKIETFEALRDSA